MKLISYKYYEYVLSVHRHFTTERGVGGPGIMHWVMVGAD